VEQTRDLEPEPASGAGDQRALVFETCPRHHLAPGLSQANWLAQDSA
jgi:hypothetical protein